ncbi:MAG: hypothetical protein KF850_41660 [Labilithrix sp.]|nr:hypothetical protein [Labilithrix sp.]MBX3218587.1 hypothetical protein [Labilithrix sp.]
MSAVPPATIARRPTEHLSRPAPPAAAEDEVGVEATMLHTARRCLAAGDYTCARSRLTDHDRRFGRTGALADEAALLAIDVALAEGRTEEARRLARAALSQRPQGTFPARVRKLAVEPDE